MKHIKVWRVWGLVAILVIALAFPIILPNPAVTSIAIFTLLFAGAATSWNIFSGYTGYISLGHAGFYGLGAYSLALMCQDWHVPGGYVPFLLLPLAGLITGICAIPIGWLALKTRRQTFVVISLSIFVILQLLAFNLAGFTNGSAGIFLPNPPWSSDIFDVPFYYAALTLLLLALAVSWRIRYSKYGLDLLAIRDDEDRALSLGVRTGLFKLSAYVVSAVFIGMIGATIAYFDGAVYPPFAFDPSFDVVIALMVLLGGIGTLPGPILGALLLVPIQQYLTLELGQNGLDLVFYGVLLLVIVLMLPQGIIPMVQRFIKRRMRERKGFPLKADAVGNATPS